MGSAPGRNALLISGILLVLGGLVGAYMLYDLFYFIEYNDVWDDMSTFFDVMLFITFYQILIGIIGAVCCNRLSMGKYLLAFGVLQILMVVGVQLFNILVMGDSISFNNAVSFLLPFYYASGAKKNHDALKAN